MAMAILTRQREPTSILYLRYPRRRGKRPYPFLFSLRSKAPARESLKTECSTLYSGLKLHSSLLSTCCHLLTDLSTGNGYKIIVEQSTMFFLLVCVTVESTSTHAVFLLISRSIMALTVLRRVSSLMGEKVSPMINRSLARDFGESTKFASIDLLRTIKTHRSTLYLSFISFR